MALDVEIGGLPNPEKWDRFVRGRKGTNIYQETPWLRLFESIGTFTPFHITVTRGGNIVGVFPNFRRSLGKGLWETQSLPFSYGGPVWGPNPEEIFAVIFAVLEQNDRSIKHTIRLHGPQAAGLSGILADWQYRPFMTDCLPIIDLRVGATAALEQATAANRRDLKRAERHGVTLIDSPLREADLESFYALYLATMQEIRASLIFSLDFLQNFAGAFQEDAPLMAAYRNGEMVAARVHLADPRRGRLHFLYSAASAEGKRVLAGSLLHQFCLDWATQRGFHYYDMGSTRADNRDSLYRHKVSWGAEAQLAPQWVKIRRPLLFGVLKLLAPLWRRGKRATLV
jgi:hypothetical protein